MPEIRITGGTLRGRKLTVPQSDLRPTSARARQAYFNIIAGRVPGARFLDLFAGTGIFSFEAVSRGASMAQAVEQSGRFADAIANAASRLGAPVRVLRADVFSAPERLAGASFDLVYADPPYAFGRYPDLLEMLDSGSLLSAGAVVAVEHRRGPLPFDPGAMRNLIPRKTAAYSDVAITLLDRG